MVLVVWSYSSAPVICHHDGLGTEFQEWKLYFVHLSDWPSGPPSLLYDGYRFLSRDKRAKVGRSWPVQRLQFGSLCSIVSIVSIPLTVWSSV
jgi:hypothetical protein